eukprot:4501313-Pleurochrysis_carterae.AAC.2
MRPRRRPPSPAAPTSGSCVETRRARTRVMEGAHAHVAARTRTRRAVRPRGQHNAPQTRRRGGR